MLTYLQGSFLSNIILLKREGLNLNTIDKSAVINILKVHKDYFHTGETKNIDFRIASLKKLKDSIKKYEILRSDCISEF